MGEWNQLLKNLKDEGQIEMWMIICWLIWNSKNKCFHERSCNAPTLIVSYAQSLKNEFETVNLIQDQVAQQHPLSLVSSYTRLF